MGTTANFILMFLLVSLLSPSRSYASPRVTEDLIAALANTLLTTVYHDDGAADATITAQSTQDPSRQGAPAQVRAILDLGPSCIPVLVAHLDDQRLTSAKFDWGAHAPIQVPLGYICLDILLHATSGNTVHVVDYVDDGLGARIRSGYYFRPDILRRRAGAATMRRVKARWQRAYPVLALTSVKKAKSEYAVRFQI